MSEEGKDIFDDLDALKVPRPEVERAPIGMVVKPARIKRAEPFGMITLRMAKDIGGITNVAAHLAYQMALSGGKPVPATAARTGCNNKHNRHRALKWLERRGYADIEWRGQGATPLIKRLDLS
jgi:hypothetical protein